MEGFKREEKNPGDIIRIILIVFFSLVFLASLIYLSIYAYQSLRNRQQGQLAVDRYVSGESDREPAIRQPEQIVTSGDTSEELPDEPQLLEVDFDALQAASGDVCGWIQVSGLDIINYPLVWREDNDYYTSHTWDGKDSRYGAIFLDQDNSNDLRDAYSMIYGHNMKDGSMFGQLKKYRDEQFFLDNGGQVILYLPDRTCVYQIFSVRHVASNAESVYTLGFDHDEAFGEYLQYMVKDSLYDTGVPVSKEDSVITLSTCSGDDRLVLHAKLETTISNMEKTAPSDPS